MDTERALVSKLVTTGQLEKAMSRGIREDLFRDEDCRKAFAYLRDYTRRYNCPPSPDFFKDDNPDFDIEHTQDPLPALLDRFILLAKRRFGQEQVMELAKVCDDPERANEIEQSFLEVSRKLATLVPSSEVASFAGGMDARIDEYEERVKEGDVKGISFGPFPQLDEWTKGGIKKHQFVTVVGFTGTGKSTLLKSTAFNAWVQGKTPLYFSLEEDSEEIYERLDAMAAKLPFADLSHLRLKPEQIKNWREYAASVREGIADIPVLDGGRNVTPDTVYAEMVRHKPSIVIIDYLSLMKPTIAARNSSMWQSLTEITQDLKLIARTMKIPIFAAAQTNRSGGKDGAELDNVGYSMSVVQDADISLGLFADEEMKERNEMQIRVNKNRRGRLGKITAIWNHEELIFREKEPGDMYQRTPEPERHQEQKKEPQPLTAKTRERPKR